MLDEKRIKEAESNVGQYLNEGLLKKEKALTSLQRAKEFVFRNEKAVEVNISRVFKVSQNL